MKFVEMFGLPGVGKSTLTNEFARFAAESDGGLGFKNSVILSQQLKYGAENLGPLDVEVMLFHKRWFFYVVYLYLHASCGRRMALKRMKWTFDVLKVFSQCKGLDVRKGILLRDEGFCCRGFSLALSMEGRGFLSEYFYRMPAPDCVVFLSASVECIRERVAKRAAENAGVVSNFIKDYGFYLDFLAMAEDVLRERGVNVFKINAEEDLRLQISSLDHFLQYDLSGLNSCVGSSLVAT